MQNLLTLKPGTVAEDGIGGSLQLDAWKGAQASGRPSNGLIDVQLEGCDPEDGSGQPVVTQAQINAITYLLQNAEKSRDAVLKAILEQLPKWEDVYGDLLPKVSIPAEIKQHVSLRIIHIHPLEKDDMAYIGYELDCSWDEEHGLGIIMHRERMIKFGLADVAFGYLTGDEDSTEETDTPPFPENPAEPARPWWKIW